MIRRPLGAAARTLPIFILFGIPVALGLPEIYEWARPEAANDHLLAQKAMWLNPQGWIIRALIYFALWALWAWRLRALSLKFYEDRSQIGRASCRERGWNTVA